MAEEEMLFDPTMKKKKKKKVINLDDLDEVKTSVVNSAEPEKEKNSVTFNEESGEQEKEKEKSSKISDDLDLDDFSNLKKKKKKKSKKDPLDLDALAETLPTADGAAEDENKENADTVNEDDTREYTYDELLARVFDIMRAKNPNMVEGGKRKFVMKPPQVVRVGTKRTSFVNFAEICKILHRQSKHLLAFLLAELGTSGTVDGTNQLIIKGRFQQKHIENVLRRYIREYVTCHTCRSADTILHKEGRLFFLQCETCGARCSVQAIKSGFQAQTSKRSQLKNKTG